MKKGAIPQCFEESPRMLGITVISFREASRLLTIAGRFTLTCAAEGSESDLCRLYLR